MEGFDLETTLFMEQLELHNSPPNLSSVVSHLTNKKITSEKIT